MPDTARLIDGREISKGIIAELTARVKELREGQRPIPGLVTILVGDHPASVSYVTLKSRTAQKIGFHQVQEDLPVTITEEELLDLIARYNHDRKIHGILVQLPLPPHIDAEKVNLAIAPEKDVDCFHPYNQGAFFAEFRDNQLAACTPAGIMEMLKRLRIPTQGKHVVILGRSNLVGKPMLLMMLEKNFGGNATITAIHSGTPDLSVHTRQADILIAAAGKPKLITADMVKPGAVVIDVGVNRIGEKIGKAGKPVTILCGDVDFEAVKEKASYITPVPGGVGPMTIAMLMQNTLIAFNRIEGIS